VLVGLERAGYAGVAALALPILLRIGDLALEAFGALVRDELGRWTKVIREAGIVIE